MLKIDLHLHTREDPTNNPVIDYSAFELIDKAARLGFDAIAITPFNGYIEDKKVYEYARKKQVLLLAGTEKQVEGYEVLCINITKKEFDEIKTFDDMRRIKSAKNLFIAPHPFYLRPGCLGKKLVENINLFDAIEYSHFYLSVLNLNKKAEKIARIYHKPLVGTSDAHKLKQLNYTYTLVDARKNAGEIVKAIKKGRISLITRPLPLGLFLHIAFWNIASLIRYRYRKLI